MSLENNAALPLYSNERYTVGWICAIPTEYVAAQAFLDEVHDRPEYVHSHDNNDYTLGKIGKHYIVIAVLPDGEYGVTSAAAVARDMLHSFLNIRVGLLVGIGGGAPTPKQDIRLGDVVVCSPRDGKSGVFQYDFGKTIQEKSFQSTGSLNLPPMVLRTAVGGLKAKYESDGHQLLDAVERALQKKPRLKKRYSRPNPDSDRLYLSEVTHGGDGEESCANVCGEDVSKLFPRGPRTEDEDNPAIHHGTIASANQLMKDALLRDKFARENGVLCFEMEAAGLMNHFPCLVIRGICDYADTHKNKDWQCYAAMVAAAYAKDLLLRISVTKVEAETRLADILGDVKEDVQTVIRDVRGIQEDQHRRKIATWLSSPEPSTNFNKARKQHQEGSGGWFLESSEYAAWKTDRNSFLWLSGIPGSGKTILSSTIIADLKGNSPQKVLYFYFDFSDKSKQIHENLIRQLVLQLYQDGKRYEKLDHLYANCGEGREQPGSKELIAVLLDMIKSAGESWIILDALDECSLEDGGLFALIGELRDADLNIHLLITGRPEHAIVEAVGVWGCGSKVISLEKARHQHDIDAYIKTRTKNIVRWKERPDIQTQIENSLSEKAHGMFRWVSCQFDTLEACLDPPAVREALSQLPRTLDDTYDVILRRLHPDHLRYTTRLLQFLTYAERPLRLKEAVDALNVDITRRPSFDIADRMPNPKEITRYGGGLFILVDAIEDTQRDIAVVRILQLAHFSVKEYLLSKRPKAVSKAFEDALREPEAYQAMTDVCLRYLLDLNHHAPAHKLTEIYPFATLSASSWTKYARKAEKFTKKSLDSVSEYLSSHSAFELGQVLSTPKCYQVILYHQPLIYAAFEGLYYLVKTLIGDGADVNLRDVHLGHALQAASYRGHEDIVRMLLDHGANVNMENGYYGTALQAASAGGHHGVVQTLLARGADPNVEGGWCTTALLAATAAGIHQAQFPYHKNILEANPENLGYSLQTVIEDSSRKIDYTEIAKTLINAGARLRVGNNSLGEPLHLASATGLIEVVQLLLDKGIDANVAHRKYETGVQRATGSGQKHAAASTALHYAIGNGRTEITQLLVDSGADVNLPSARGETPLGIAISVPYESIVRILLAGHADVDAPTGFGMTPLHMTVESGLTGIVKLLLDAGANVSPSGFMPLHMAVRQDYAAIVKLLLDAKADVHATDDSGQTPLHHAGQYAPHNRTQERVKIIRLLLENGADINMRDINSDTALNYAVYNGYKAATQILLDHGADLNIRNRSGYTALQIVHPENKKFLQILLDKWGKDTQELEHRKTRPGTRWRSLSFTHPVLAPVFRRPIEGFYYSDDYDDSYNSSDEDYDDHYSIMSL
ncbi:unnamed protein product [Periconia digitata]|uniref:Uncharacterized protein n=1 Tax=Periconia digitata TaxID=1303443 RepID=A0A9W4UEQ5_9PLEO|nr:unnamed protein product [Periconia digitata]